MAAIEPNATQSLATCEPWELKISGGERPYTILLAETHAGTITEVTLGVEDDTLVYNNRADPNWQLMGKFLQK